MSESNPAHSGPAHSGPAHSSPADSENLGRLDDAAEAAEPSSTTDGPAALGEYDPAQGSPDSGAHPIFDELTKATIGHEVTDDQDTD